MATNTGILNKEKLDAFTYTLLSALSYGRPTSLVVINDSKKVFERVFKQLDVLFSSVGNFDDRMSSKVRPHKKDSIEKRWWLNWSRFASNAAVVTRNTDPGLRIEAFRLGMRVIILTKKNDDTDFEYYHSKTSDEDEIPKLVEADAMPLELFRFLSFGDSINDRLAVSSREVSIDLLYERAISPYIHGFFIYDKDNYDFGKLKTEIKNTMDLEEFLNITIFAQLDSFHEFNHSDDSALVYNPVDGTYFGFLMKLKGMDLFVDLGGDKRPIDSFRHAGEDVIISKILEYTFLTKKHLRRYKNQRVFYNQDFSKIKNITQIGVFHKDERSNTFDYKLDDDFVYGSPSYILCHPELGYDIPKRLYPMTPTLRNTCIKHTIKRKYWHQQKLSGVSSYGSITGQLFRKSGISSVKYYSYRQLVLPEKVMRLENRYIGMLGKRIISPSGHLFSILFMSIFLPIDVLTYLRSTIANIKQHNRQTDDIYEWHGDIVNTERYHNKDELLYAVQAVELLLKDMKISSFYCERIKQYILQNVPRGIKPTVSQTQFENQKDN